METGQTRSTCFIFGRFFPSSGGVEAPGRYLIAGRLAPFTKKNILPVGGGGREKDATLSARDASAVSTLFLPHCNISLSTS